MPTNLEINPVLISQFLPSQDVVQPQIDETEALLTLLKKEGTLSFTESIKLDDNLAKLIKKLPDSAEKCTQILMYWRELVPHRSKMIKPIIKDIPEALVWYYENYEKIESSKQPPEVLLSLIPEEQKKNNLKSIWQKYDQVASPKRARYEKWMDALRNRINLGSIPCAAEWFDWVNQGFPSEKQKLYRAYLFMQLKLGYSLNRKFASAEEALSTKKMDCTEAADLYAKALEKSPWKKTVYLVKTESIVSHMITVFYDGSAYYAVDDYEIYESSQREDAIDLLVQESKQLIRVDLEKTLKNNFVIVEE